MPNIYHQQLLEHAKEPRNKKRLERPTVTSDYSNPSCGDSIVLDLEFDKNKKLISIGYDMEGCAISEASSSLLSEYILEMSYDELLKVNETEFWDLLGVELSPTRKKCALISFNALLGALGKYKSLQ